MQWCSSGTLRPILSHLGLSFALAATLLAVQDKGRRDSDFPGSSRLASLSVVCRHGEAGHRHSLAIAFLGGPPVPESSLPPSFIVSGSVIPTMLNTCESTSRKIYRRTLKAHFA